MQRQLTPMTTKAVDKDTVSIHFVVAAVARLAPAVRIQVLAAAGIGESLLRLPGARVPAKSFATLWVAVARAIDDEFFALDRRGMKVGSFALLSRAALASADLGQALKLIQRSFPVFLDEVGVELRIEESYADVGVVNRLQDADARLFADETMLVMIHGLVCWLVGWRIVLREVRFAHRRVAHAAEYVMMFSENVVFDAPTSAIRFDARLLRSPIVQNERTLRSFLLAAPQSVFLKYRNGGSWTARVRRDLRAAIDHRLWPGLDDLARDHHVAVPTLRRRLEREGSSYQGIKDSLRRDAAVHYLCDTRLSVAEIGERLGFQEQSAFCRAFKKWTGAQPGQYRRDSQDDGSSKPTSDSIMPE